MSSRRFAGQVALISGSGQGLGRAVAERLASEGARVVVHDRYPSADLETFARSLDGSSVAADLAQPAELEAAVASVMQEVGSIDVLICNAAEMAMGGISEQPLDRWWRQINVNLSGTFNLIRAVLPAMRQRGHGQVVVVTSEWGVIGGARATAYCASKAGLNALVSGLGKELASEGIVVNGIAPGAIDTPQLQVDAADAGLSLADLHEQYRRAIPLGRIARPEEIAASIAHLASPAGASLAGEVLQVNGGSTRAGI